MFVMPCFFYHRGKLVFSYVNPLSADKSFPKVFSPLYETYSGKTIKIPPNKIQVLSLISAAITK
jgi:hypothetical protein